MWPNAVWQAVHEYAAGRRPEPALAVQLTQDYGNGCAEKSLQRMVQFVAIFPDEPIVATPSRQLCWLDKYEREPEEASPFGIILRTGKKSEQFELLESSNPADTACEIAQPR